jgi:hypothetical protein
MRRTIIVAAFALFAIPTSAMAADTTRAAADDATAAARAECRAEKQGTGTKLFKQTYAAKSTSRAMKACVAATEPVVAAAAKNAAKTCKAMRTDDPATFEATYGTKKNAYGKCVSATAKATTEEATEARVNAAKTCKAMRADDRTAFDTTYGTKKNAFGKCVSATAKANADGDA